MIKRYCLEVVVKNLLLTFCLLLLVATVGLAEAQSFPCDEQPMIVVNVEDETILTDICSAAYSAISFLAQYSLSPHRSILINIVDEPIVIEGYHAFGSYDTRSEEVCLMSYQTIFANVEDPRMYGEPFDSLHYAGIVAHEVAHAIMLHNLYTKHKSSVSQEYLAHATQLAVMPSERRNKIIETMDVGPWVSGDTISDTYMAMEPGKFAVKSYLHLTTTEKPQEFVQLLLRSSKFYVYVP